MYIYTAKNTTTQSNLFLCTLLQIQDNKVLKGFALLEIHEPKDLFMHRQKYKNSRNPRVVTVKKLYTNICTLLEF